MAFPPPEKVNGKSDLDVTGRDRMISNVLSSWGGHFVFIVAGFVMPRMIDRHVGQVSLGIWDFSWSFVSYFGIMGLGVGSSINRYVAKLRAEGDRDGLVEAVSSVVCLQVVIATAIGIMTVAAVILLPHFFSGHQGSELSDARWVVGLLGTYLTIQQGFDVFRGVITGCHRWDLHNAINSTSYAITVVVMIGLLILGHGLRSLAAAYLGVGFATEIYRFVAARRICPDLEIRAGKATWKQGKAMLSFGVKTVILGLPALIIVQGSSLLIARHLGAAMLAVFSRPSGLIRNAQTFIGKYALVLTPTAGSLQGAGRYEEIRELMIRTTRYSVALALPIVLFLAILGDPILYVWMGPRYEAGRVMAILVCGSFIAMTQQSVMTILVGLNAHGRVGAVNLVLSIVTIVIGAIVLDIYGWSLIGASLVIAIFATVNGVSVLLSACRKLGIPFVELFRKSFVGPMTAGVPHAIALAAVRITLGNRPLIALGAGCAASALILVPIYWKFFLPRDIQTGIRRLAKSTGLAWLLGPP